MRIRAFENHLQENVKKKVLGQEKKRLFTATFRRVLNVIILLKIHLEIELMSQIQIRLE